MERYSMFLGRKNQYCENEYATKCNLQIQCNPYQITNDIFHRTRTKNFTIHVKHERSRIAKAVLRKKNGAGGIILTSDYTTKQQSSRQYGTVTKNRNTDQWNKIESPEIKPCTLFLTKEARIYNGAKAASSINGAWKTGQLYVKE